MTENAAETPSRPGPGSARTFPVFCSLIPRELLRLAGYRQVEVAPETGDCGAGLDRCALSDCLCSWARFLAGRLAGPASPFPLVVVPNSCDALARLRDALVREAGDRQIFFLDVPRNCRRVSPPCWWRATSRPASPSRRPPGSKRWWNV